MRPGEHLLIFGASARAAAFSALRAGLRPWCVDLFADADLRRACPVLRLPGKYPAGFADVAAGVAGPWLYTGGLENHPALVRAVSARRPLWGNDAAVLRRCRQPVFLQGAAVAAGLPAPALAGPRDPPKEGRWLLKPLAGAGGAGIRFWSGRGARRRPGTYLQEYVEGLPAAVLFCAASGSAHLLGLTRQLVGEAWLDAPPFGYCGSIGPLPLPEALESALRRLGDRLAAEGGLRGLFGVDGVLRGGDFWPVEINPRYTASVEVLEHACGLRALELHRLAFEDEPAARSADLPEGGQGVVGKAIVYARADIVFPAQGPWSAAPAVCRAEEMPDFADVPEAGERIAAGRPVLTVLARAAGAEECLAALRARCGAVQEGLGWSGLARGEGGG